MRGKTSRCSSRLHLRQRWRTRRRRVQRRTERGNDNSCGTLNAGWSVAKSWSRRKPSGSDLVSLFRFLDPPGAGPAIDRRDRRFSHRDAPPMPKNEAERILEVLEGMGRTPLGEAKRASTRVSCRRGDTGSLDTLTAAKLTFKPPRAAQAHQRPAAGRRRCRGGQAPLSLVDDHPRLPLRLDPLRRPRRQTSPLADVDDCDRKTRKEGAAGRPPREGRTSPAVARARTGRTGARTARG